MSDLSDVGRNLPGMRPNYRNDHVAPRSLAISRSNPCICTGYPDRFNDDAGRRRITDLIFEKAFGQRGTAGTKIGYNSNLAAEHGGLLVAENF